VKQLDLAPKGHVTTPDLPTITPFDEGTPRYPVRLFSAEGVSVAALMSELFVPVTTAQSFSGALLDCAAAADVGETRHRSRARDHRPCGEDRRRERDEVAARRVPGQPAPASTMNTVTKTLTMAKTNGTIDATMLLTSAPNESRMPTTVTPRR